MIIDIGYYTILVATVLSVYTIICSLAGIHRDSQNLIQSSLYSQVFVFIAVAGAYLALSYGFLSDDFSVRFIAENSSTDLPSFYKLTAVWGGMRGSLLLWELILSLFTVIVIIRYRASSRDILPYTVIVLSTISLFLLFLLVGWSNPFERLYPIPLEGNGLNPLLQNPGMVYHPPSLYIGYVGFSVPFAFAIGSLLRGKVDNEWVLTTRRWTLVSWFFLTLGMVLGAQWAYVELGWGGYWSWDPVENASLMPWLTGTAFLHSVIVQEKRNALKNWNMLLIIATFILSILGTFITRSGILGSVHSFSKSNIGPAFLAFITVTLFVSYGLLLTRQSVLSVKPQRNGFFCKENSFLVNNIVFTVMAFTVMYGTLFPLLAEALANKKLSIQAPFFNTIMTPIGIFLILLMGVTHLLGWKKTSHNRLLKNIRLPLSLSAIAILLVSISIGYKWQVWLFTGTIVFAGSIIGIEYVKSYRLFSKRDYSNSGSVLSALFKDRRRKGGLMIHFGIVLLAIGICGNYFNVEDTFTLSPGESKTVEGYTLRFNSVREFQQRNARQRGAELTIFADTRETATMLPSKAYYPTSRQPMTEVAILRSVIEDLYVSLSDINPDGSVTLVVFINPLVNFVWASMFFFLVGILYSLSYKPVQLRIEGR